jgi:hypothetical protein
MRDMEMARTRNPAKTQAHQRLIPLAKKSPTAEAAEACPEGNPYEVSVESTRTAGSYQ